MTDTVATPSITPAIFAKKPPAPKLPTFFDPVNPSCTHITEGDVWCQSCSSTGYKACKKRVNGLIHIKASDYAITEAMLEFERMEYEHTFTAQGNCILDTQFYRAIYNGDWNKAYYLNDLKEIRREQAILRSTNPEQWVCDFVPEIKLPEFPDEPEMPTIKDMRSVLFAPDDYVLQLTQHAKVRMEEREITLDHIYEIYKNPKGLRVQRNNHFYLTDFHVTVVGSINTVRGVQEFSVLTTYYNNSSEKD